MENQAHHGSSFEDFYRFLIPAVVAQKAESWVHKDAGPKAVQKLAQEVGGEGALEWWSGSFSTRFKNSNSYVLVNR